jgi:hypothetical protein
MEYPDSWSNGVDRSSVCQPAQQGIIHDYQRKIALAGCGLYAQEPLHKTGSSTIATGPPVDYIYPCNPSLKTRIQSYAKNATKNLYMVAVDLAGERRAAGFCTKR